MYPGALIADRYRLEELIGAGSMGQVWRARDDRLDREVAVKVVDLTQATAGVTRERFQREVVATAKLHHPNIVTTFDGGLEGDLAFMVMELARGETLAVRIKRLGSLSVHEGARIGLEVARALEATHAIGVVHRDIKPANVMVDGSSVKVLDFGIAQLTEGPEVTAKDVIGTAAFMSPEQARGERASTASDLYSLGCLLVAMLAGRPPFVGDTSLAVARQQIEDAPPRLRTLRPDAPAALEALVAELLAKRPQDRPDAPAVVARLRAFCAGSASQATAVLPPADPTARMPAGGPAPATARRRDAGGADPRLGATAVGGGRDRWFARGVKWVLLGIAALATLLGLWALGTRLIAMLPPAPRVGTPAPKSTATAAPLGPTLPQINLPTITLPTLPRLPPIPTVPTVSAQKAAIAGVTTALDSWSPRTDKEAQLKQQLKTKWATASDKIVSGKNAQKALDDYTAEVEKAKKAGTMPMGAYAAVSMALRAVAATV